MVNKKICTLIFCVLQVAFINSTFAVQIQDTNQQQQIQDQQQHHDIQSDDEDNNDGLYGLITDTHTPPDDVAQTQDQSTADSDADSKINTQSDDDTQLHVCIYPPPHKGHDPCTKGCGCLGNHNGFPCYAQCWAGHTFELEKKADNSGPCILCGKTIKSK